jgi:tripeptidyl-peptidase-1
LTGPLTHANHLAAMYNFTQATKNATGNQMGIFEALGDTYAQQDLDSFFFTLAGNIPNGTHPILRAVDGATAPTTVLAAGPESGKSRAGPGLQSRS